MVGAFLFRWLVGASGGLQEDWREAYRPDARLPVLSLLRAIPDVIFRSLELNDHTFFYEKLKRGIGSPEEPLPAY
jgi:hypothetical protein